MGSDDFRQWRPDSDEEACFRRLIGRLRALTVRKERKERSVEPTLEVDESRQHASACGEIIVDGT